MAKVLRATIVSTSIRWKLRLSCGHTWYATLGRRKPRYWKCPYCATHSVPK